MANEDVRRGERRDQSQKIEAASWQLSVYRRLRGLTVSLVGELGKIKLVGQHAESDDGEREHLGAGFEMSGESVFFVCQRQVGVDAAVHDVTVHADQIGRMRGVLDVSVL